VLPIQQAILRSAYVATLITFVSSLALAALFVILANAVVGAIEDGGRDSNVIKNRKDAVNRLLDSE
jgi:Zn-dependent protease